MMNVRHIRLFLFIAALSCLFLLGLAIVQRSHLANAGTLTPAPLILAQASNPQVETTIPESLYPCLPRAIERIEQLGQIQQDQENFYLLGAFQGTRYWELLVQTDTAGCLLVKGQQDTEPLSAYIPLETAQQLSLQAYQRRIEEAGGLQAFQQSFTAHMNEPADGDIVYLTPEDVWALQQLGVAIPEGTYQIRQPGTAPDFDRLPDPRSPEAK